MERCFIHTENTKERALFLVDVLNNLGVQNVSVKFINLVERYGIEVNSEDARGAYARLKDVSMTKNDSDDLSLTTVSADFGSSLVAEARKRTQQLTADAVVTEIQSLETGIQQNKLTIRQNEKNLSINVRRLAALEQGNFKLNTSSRLYGTGRLIIYNEDELNVW